MRVAVRALWAPQLSPEWRSVPVPLSSTRSGTDTRSPCLASLSGVGSDRGWLLHPLSPPHLLSFQSYELISQAWSAQGRGMYFPDSPGFGKTLLLGHARAQRLRFGLHLCTSPQASLTKRKQTRLWKGIPAHQGVCTWLWWQPVMQGISSCTPHATWTSLPEANERAWLTFSRAWVRSSRQAADFRDSSS